MNGGRWIALTILVVAVVSLALAWPSGAQQEQTLRIAVINGGQVIDQSQIGQSVQEQAQQLREQLQAGINAKRQEVDTLVRQAQEQGLTLNAEARARLEEQIEEGQLELQRMSEDANRQLNRFLAQGQEQINEQLIPAVEQLAQQGGYDLVLESQMDGLYHFSADIDATAELIAIVNASGPGGQ